METWDSALGGCTALDNGGSGNCRSRNRTLSWVCLTTVLYQQIQKKPKEFGLSAYGQVSSLLTFVDLGGTS